MTYKTLTGFAALIFGGSALLALGTCVMVIMEKVDFGVGVQNIMGFIFISLAALVIVTISAKRSELGEGRLKTEKEDVI
jgi:hypothetical protein